MPAFILAAYLALFPANPATLTAPQAQAAHIAPDYSTSTLRAYARQTALADGLDADLFVRVLGCESGFIWNARGDNDTSFGIGQFHDLKDWRISTTTAFDPYASIDLAGKAWQEGLAGHWSCYAIEGGK